MLSLPLYISFSVFHFAVVVVIYIDIHLCIHRASYAVVGYGIPIAATMYHTTVNRRKNYLKTRDAFTTSGRCFVFPFYFHREQLEAQLRSKLESATSQFIFIYGKPFIGKSTLIRKIGSQIQDGIMRIHSYSFQPFHKTLSKRIGFTFNDQYTWTNLWKNIHFPLAICTTPKGSPQQQLQRTLDYLSTFCRKYAKSRNKPWILTIDDADNLDKSQFEQIYNSVQPLIDENVLTIAIISSDPAFAAFVSDKNKFGKITRFQMDEMDENESRQFLESQPCQLFVNRMRKHHGFGPMNNKQDISKCYAMAGGIPLWLIQCAVKSPNKWYKHRLKTVKRIIDQQENSNDIYRMQQYIINHRKTGIGFKEFIKESGSIDNAIKLLHGIPSSSKHNRLFFHDLNKNNISLQYEYLKQMSILSQIEPTTN